MNLRRRILFISLGTIAIMGTIALLSMFLLRATNLSLLTVVEEYGELRDIDLARSRLEDARLALTEQPPRLKDARDALTGARDVIESFVEIQHMHDGAEEDHHAEEAVVGNSLIVAIDRMITSLPDGAGHTDGDLKALRNQIDQEREVVLTLAGTANRLVDDALLTTQHRTALANLTLVTLCLTGVLFVLLFAFLQYRWVLHPVLALRNRVRDAVAARRQERVTTDTPDPVGDLGRGFNEMINELDGLYDSLEIRVVQKSKELVMAERLASVGYLAAGVAHEINNPLNAILGYTELTLRDLRRFGDDARKAGDSLEIIRSEAMRCKHIVEKLLSLVRNSDAPREAVEVDRLVRDVVAIIQALRQFRNFSIDTQIEDGPQKLCILAREPEIKQVLLNLIINAIEASPDGGGQVRVVARMEEASKTVRIEVSDDGHGMDETTRRQVFEPFFSRKRGSSRSGTGLGLSVVHAIVQDHGGQISAHSDGIGMGSRFVVRLPATAPVLSEV